MRGPWPMGGGGAKKRNETNIVGVKLEVLAAVKMKFCVFCCDIVYSDGNIPMFQRNFLPPRRQIISE
jgi:hypothetical protein